MENKKSKLAYRIAVLLSELESILQNSNKQSKKYLTEELKRIIKN